MRHHFHVLQHWQSWQTTSLAILYLALSHHICITKNKYVLISLIPSLILLSSRQHEMHPLQFLQLFEGTGNGKSINLLINRETAYVESGLHCNQGEFCQPSSPTEFNNGCWKNVHSSIRSSEWENKVTWQSVTEQDDRSMKQRIFTWHSKFCNNYPTVSVKI